MCCPTILLSMEEGAPKAQQDAKVKGVRSDFARDHKSGRVADGSDRPCVVADAGTDAELRTHGVALTNSKMVFPRPALLHPQDVNADL